MNIIHIDYMMDGGTVLVHTDKGYFAIDHRFGSRTKGDVYKGYPEDDNSNRLKNQEIKTELELDIKDYEKEIK